MDTAGLHSLTFEAVARAARAGKAALRRRWPDLEALVVDAVRAHQPVLRPLDTGGLDTDIEAVLRGWRTPVTRQESALAAVLNLDRCTGSGDAIGPALARSAVDDLVDVLVARTRGRGRPVTAAHESLLRRALLALFLHRLCAGAHPPVQEEGALRLLSEILGHPR
ncbi:hypothetical protein ACWKWC_01260 [Geodermatophilus nigrescens]